MTGNPPLAVSGRRSRGAARAAALVALAALALPLLVAGAPPAAAPPAAALSDPLPDAERTTVSTVAGMGRYNGDGQLGKDATLTMPFGQGVIGTLGHPFAGLAVDAAGNLYVADRGNNRVRKIAPDWRLYSVAGTGAAEHSGDSGSARAVALNQPTAVAVGPDGGVYIADSRNGLIRRLDPASGALTTVAGNAEGEGAGPLAPLRARNARLSFPEGVAAGADGTIYVADTGAHRVRAVAPDGALLTVAGPRACPTIRDDLFCPHGESGDGGSAGQALLRAPRGVAVDAAGRVLVADTENNRVRLLTPPAP
jgi:streptogramin lyase